MPTNFPLFLAMRYLRGVSGSVSTMVRVCALGIFVSCAALAITLAVMRGFEQAMHEKLQGIHAHILIRAHGNLLDHEKIGAALTKFPEMRAWAPQDSKHVMVGDTIMALKGVEPAQEAQVSKMEQYMVKGRWLTAQDTNAVVVGTCQAQQSDLSVGDSINVLYAPEEQSGRKLVFESAPATIVGIFQTGIEEYDTNVLFTPFANLAQLFPSAGYTQIGIRVQPGADQKKLLARLQSTLTGLDVYGWQDLYPALLSATVLERTVMLLILGLMGLVASLSMVALLFMQITIKRPDIAILSALGSSRRQISAVFLMLGTLITALATIAGLLFAWGVCLFLQYYPLLQLPDAYYATHVPVAIEASNFLLVGMVTLLLGLLATWYPVQRAQRFSVTEILRHE